ncbi:MAG: glycosyltransferase [Methylovirgula sp.]
MPSLPRDATETLRFLSTKPLTKKRVIVVHPAWHSCGSHQVFVSQMRAYRTLGANVHSLAIADFPGWSAGSKAHQTYLAATQDLIADRRHFAGMAWPQMATRRFLGALDQWLHGDAAAMLCATASNARLPAELLSLAQVDFIHCNHFFCMPVARALKRKYSCPVLLDTHDVQARQFSLRNAKRWRLPPKASFEDMLARERAEMREADLLIHLNDEEAQSWRAFLPDMAHVLIYPAIKPVPTAPGGHDIIIVASANYPNYLSVKWFLTEVLPLASDIPVRIIGNIDQIFRAEAPALFAKHAQLFSGRIDDLEGAYANAAAILLPTTSGHGISIKTIEALSSGAPLIATREAFRGIAIDPATLANVTLAKDAEDFAAALRRRTDMPLTPPQARQTSDTRRLYERLFAFDAYAEALAEQVHALLSLR